MGRSRGGLTTKIHALVDAEGRPILLKLTEGQAHDGRSADDMLASIRQGSILLADRAYDRLAIHPLPPIRFWPFLVLPGLWREVAVSPMMAYFLMGQWRILCRWR